MPEQEPKLETQKWHHNFWVRLGSCAVVGAALMTYGSVLLGHQRTSLEDNLGNKIDPAAEDIEAFTEKVDAFTGRVDGFLEEYQEFRVDICQSALGAQMEGCEQVLADAAEAEASGEEAAPQTTTTVVSIPPTTVTTAP